MRANEEIDETQCAERFCRVQQPSLTNFTKMRQDSAVDVHAESPDGIQSRDFQITNLWPKEFWEPFACGQIEMTVTWEELRELFRQSIQNKLAHMPSLKGIDLLIDCKPVDFLPQCLSKLHCDRELQREVASLGGFRQIWAVTSDGAVQLK